ncbi:Zinc/iron permease, partial [Punctularia strigosozonata HHB-11173 SS5]|uniref:Zinc/iron permease n=1 Tax=Punctularia strigosozonata (strain HHB-11173) TaxID=741275 RepID=UPI0004417DDD
MGFPLLVVQSILLGASAFGIGMLPLSFAFSKRQTDGLSNLGTGLLLGAALGVIIPEGAETLAESTIADWEFPTNKFAVAILSGFTFMLLVEKLISGHGHHAHSQSTNIALNQRPKDTESTTVEFDADDIDLEDGHVNGTRPTHARRVSYSHIHQHQGGGTDESRARAYALTLGLVTHAFSDGLALGISALSDSTHDSSELSFIVFLALLLHKAPTTLALSASLLSLSLPRSQCKKHIAVFAASTPT